MTGWWSYPTRNLLWRLARPEDATAIEALYQDMERRIGKQDRPALLAPPVLIALVAEDEEGRIVGGLYIEAVAEITMVGLSRDVLEGAAELGPELAGFLESRKFRIARVTIPSRLGHVMRRALARVGFHSTKGLTHFARMIRK